MICTLSNSEIEEKCLDMNGFVIQDNIQMKYHEFFERGMAKVAELKRNDDYNKMKRRIYTLSDVQSETVEEDKFKNRWVLAKVVNVARGLPGRNGRQFDKLEISDGYVKVTIFGRISQVFQKGRVIVFPITLYGENKKIYIDDYTMNKLDPVVLEED